jgi:hypothetical protein
VLRFPAEATNFSLFQIVQTRFFPSPNRAEVTGGRGKLHNEDLQDLCSRSNILEHDKIMKNKMGGKCSTNRDEERCI